MSNLLEHAKEELRIAGLLESDDEMQKAMNNHILHMVEEFSKEEHSGFSASYAFGQLEKLLRFDPLTPLTGEDWEWTEYADGLYQNKRMSSVFKDGKDEQAYYLDGNVFCDQDGITFTNSYSAIPIEFPWYPQESNIVNFFERKKLK